MFLKIKTTHQPASDLGFLLHKHPDKFQTFSLTFGQVHVFYPEATETTCSSVMLLDINPIKLSRQNKRNYSTSFQLGQYVNDRPYVASSFLSSALTKVYGSALNGNCKNKPELVEQALPLEIEIAVISARGGQDIINRFFSPLGYEVRATAYPLDDNFPEWGESTYYKLNLCHTLPLHLVLSQLYVLLPALDNNKHYYVNEMEVEKLLSKGGQWLQDHPEKALISQRFLKHKKSYTRMALERLEPIIEEEKTAQPETKLEKKIRLHELRHQVILEELLRLNVQSVVDLGCGSGQLLRLLIKNTQFKKILGMDVSYRSLEIAKERLYLENMSPKKQERIQLIQGSLTYCDSRLQGFDAAVLVEVIEHLDENRLKAMEKALFGYAKPTTILITTPNEEYNVLFENLSAGTFRHADHRFEWNRADFENWGKQVADTFGYEVAFSSIGPEHEEHGAPSQMAVFTLTQKTN